MKQTSDSSLLGDSPSKVKKSVISLKVSSLGRLAAQWNEIFINRAHNAHFKALNSRALELGLTVRMVQLN